MEGSDRERVDVDAEADDDPAGVPLRAFAQRRIVLHFTRGTRLTDDVWAGATRASVTVVLRRLHTRVSTFTI